MSNWNELHFFFGNNCNNNELLLKFNGNNLTAWKLFLLRQLLYEGYSMINILDIDLVLRAVVPESGLGLCSGLESFLRGQTEIDPKSELTRNGSQLDSNSGPPDCSRINKMKVSLLLLKDTS